MSQGRVSAVVLEDNGATAVAEAAAVVFATGGFEGNAAMMREQFGAGAEAVRLISPGTRFNTGDGIRIGREAGAKVSGDWDGMHIEPIDPRSGASAPVVLVYPYGIVVDQSGQRFFDEGAGLVHETWEAFSRDIHFSRLMRIAYAILDSRLFEIEGYRARDPVGCRRLIESETIEGLAAQIGVPAGNLRADDRRFQCCGDRRCSRFDVTRCDGLATAGTDAGEIELGAADREAALSRLSPGGRSGLYVRRTCHQ